MSYSLDDTRYRHETVTVRTLQVTIVLSLLVHLAALLLWFPRARILQPGDEREDVDVRRHSPPLRSGWLSCHVDVMIGVEEP